MNPTDTVAWACSHSDLVTNLLTYGLGLVGSASIASWWSAKMPPWAQKLVQVLAMNFLHAALGDPKPAAPPPPAPPAA